MSIRATIIIPTTKDRGLLFPYSIGSILQQTLQDFEVFIIGDGVYEETRQVIHEMMKQDVRIRFFDHPKHPRRGEEYRHQALQEAQGEFITYMNDRDLLLPDHLETLSTYLSYGNLVTSLHFDVREDRIFYGMKRNNLRLEGAMVFSTVAHTLDLYKNLPYGWRTTPDKYFTDWYMWQQLLTHPSCHPYSGFHATMLYFKRGDHPGLSTPERCLELSKWYRIVYELGDFEAYKKTAIEDLIREKHFFKSQYFLFKGYALGHIPAQILKKITSYLKK